MNEQMVGWMQRRGRGAYLALELGEKGKGLGGFREEDQVLRGEELGLEEKVLWEGG